MEPGGEGEGREASEVEWREEMFGGAGVESWRMTEERRGRRSGRGGGRDVVLDGPGLRAANGPACFPRAGPCRPACRAGGPYPARLAGLCQPGHDAGRAKKPGYWAGLRAAGQMEIYSSGVLISLYEI